MSKTKQLSEDEESTRRLKMARAIRAAREAAGLTQQELATRLGRSLANIRSWEREKPPAAVPGGSIAEALAHALDSTMQALHIGREPGVLDAVLVLGDMQRAVLETKHYRDAAYPSLQEFLNEHEAEVSDEERHWLNSQRFADGDPGDVNWWAGQLMSYRKLKRNSAAHARAPTPRDERAARDAAAHGRPVIKGYRMLGESKKDKKLNG